LRKGIITFILDKCKVRSQNEVHALKYVNLSPKNKVCFARAEQL